MVDMTRHRRRVKEWDESNPMTTIDTGAIRKKLGDLVKWYPEIRALLSRVDELEAELAKVTPVVEAAIEWRLAHGICTESDALEKLDAAVIEMKGWIVDGVRHESENV